MGSLCGRRQKGSWGGGGGGGGGRERGELPIYKNQKSPAYI